MAKEVFGEIRLDLITTPFNLNHSLNCGQTFRWEKHGDLWHGVVNDALIKIRQIGEVLQFQAFPENIDDKFMWRYFRLYDDLAHIYSEIAKDNYIKDAIAKFRGLRIVRQDPWECLISFICATNKSIPAIKDMINNMCARFGKKMKVNGSEFYTFPEPQVLAQATLKDLRLCKLGFRAERVKQTSRIVCKGDLNFDALKTMRYEEAKSRLVNLPGVGPKVADCVLLFSLDQLEAFPIDVWMKRVILEFYKEHFDQTFIEKISTRNSLSPNVYKKISTFGREYFGEYVGYAQEYLYHFKRCQ